MLVRSEPVLVRAERGAVLCQVAEADVCGDEEQLPDLAPESCLRAVVGLCPRQRYLAVNAEPLVDLLARIEVDGHLVQAFVLEHAAIVVVSEGEAEVGRLGLLAHADGVEVREACFEVVGQLVAVGLVRYLSAVPGVIADPVEQGAEGVLARHADLFSVFAIDVLLFAIAALTVFVLQLDGFRSLTPSEGAGVADAPAVLLRAFLRGDEDDAVACACAVEGCRIRSFQHGYRLDVLGVKVKDGSSPVVAAVGRHVACLVVGERHAVHDPERLVVVREGRVAADGYLRGAAQSRGSRIHLDAGDFTREG